MASLTQTWRPQLERARRAWKQSPAPAFLSWWGRELRACLPVAWQGWIARGAQWRLLEIDGDSLRVRASGGDVVTSIDTTLAAELQRVALHEACADVDAEDLHLVLMVPPARALRRSLSLPQAARSRLQQVVAYEMDRQTPFTADQVYADARESAAPAAAGKLGVELVAVPKAWLDPWLERIRALDVRLDAVDVAGDHGQRLGANLLPEADRQRRPHRQRMFNLALSLLALLLIFIGMQWWLHNRRETLAAMQTRVDTMRDEARAVARLRKQVQERLGAAGFLARRKTETPGVLAVLDDISRRLPDDTWLQRVSIDADGRVGMQGESPQAAHLIDLLKASPYLEEPGFQGVIQTDPRTGHERFYIVAHLHKNGAAKKKPGGQNDATASR